MVPAPARSPAPPSLMVIGAYPAWLIVIENAASAGVVVEPRPKVSVQRVRSERYPEGRFIGRFSHWLGIRAASAGGNRRSGVLGTAGDASDHRRFDAGLAFIVGVTAGGTG